MTVEADLLLAAPKLVHILHQHLLGEVTVLEFEVEWLRIGLATYYLEGGNTGEKFSEGFRIESFISKQDGRVVCSNAGNGCVVKRLGVLVESKVAGHIVHLSDLLDG